MASLSGTPAPPLRPSARAGIRLALGGTVTQLIGIGWDALMHHWDRGLAAREGIFTIANPSHLLVAVGLGCCVAGCLIALWGTAVRRGRSRRFPTSPVIVSLGVVILSIATAGIGLATGSGGGHSHAVADKHGRAPNGHEHDEAEASPLVAELRAILIADGSGAAIARLEDLARSDEAVLQRSHHLVHAIGRMSFDHYGTSRSAFEACTPAFEWGCYHGVLEGYLDAHPALESSDLNGICPTTVDATNTNILFQCLHGLGHGLVLHLGGDVTVALQECDRLADEWQRVSCYSGVFMENLIEAQAATADGRAVDGTGLLFNPSDALYPCNALEERYLAPCYEMQSSLILWLEGRDFAEAGATCASVPRTYVPICYQGLGREAFGASLRDPTNAIPLCRSTGAARYAQYCYVGVAKNVINADANLKRASSVCRQTPEAARKACFAAIAESRASL